MEAIGQLAGGVAHDFNNILTVIHGHASLLLAGGSLTGVSARSAQQISQAAERAAGLTRQLLAFSRRQVMQPRQLDMNEVVGNMTKMLGRILGEDIALQLHYSPQPALVQADAGMMEQVLLNLAVNSRDAMPKGGVLAIKISALEVDARAAGGTLGSAGRPVRVPERHRHRLRHSAGESARASSNRSSPPRKSAKEPAWVWRRSMASSNSTRGGLRSRAKSARGRPSKCSCRAAVKPPKPAIEQPAEKAVRGGTETILVVEDEAPVRELVCNVLAGHGYRILQAESGVKALEVWRDSKEQIDLLLTDLVMPDHMNGRELAEKLWAERPRLKVIFTSGYSADVVGKDFVLRRGLNYLQKPYHPHKLALAVRDCLDAVN